MEIPRIINKSRFYRFEQKESAEEFRQQLTDREAKRFIKKIFKHYHHEPVTIKFNGHRRDSGDADYTHDVVRLAHNPKVGLAAHELAHILTKSGHTKQSLVMLEKIILYSGRRNYWRAELKEVDE